MKKVFFASSGKISNALSFVIKKRMLPPLVAFFAFLMMCLAQVNGWGQTVVINPASPWTVPAGVTSVTVEVYGGGGGGGGTTSVNPYAGGGGGGGAYSSSTLTVSSGQSYTISVTAGGGGGGYLSSQGTTSSGNGGAGGTISFTGIGGTVIAAGGSLGQAPNSNGSATGGAGGTTANSTGTTRYAGGSGYKGAYPSPTEGGGGGGGAGNAGGGGNATSGNPGTGGSGGSGSPNNAPYIGGSGGGGTACPGSGGCAGKAGNAPGGGGGGGANGTADAKGGLGGAGQVLLTYTTNPICSPPCIGWINQNCTVCSAGCYIDGGTIAPTATLQTASVSTSPSNYGYVFWTFTASADSTYYFDLCASTGTAGSSWLRLHKARTTGSNYCQSSSTDTTLVLQNMANGCTGTGTGLSKLIWTCKASGTYYLETAADANMSPWGATGSQTATLSYKTLPSFSYTCTDLFYDKGSDGTTGSSLSYNNNEDWIYTYYPLDTVHDAISSQFVSFSTSPGDILCVFDGNSINAPQIGCYSGPSITGAFSSTASDGSLTFKFTSDDTGVAAGWQANISCVANVGVRNYVSANKINVYPNPVKDKLVISHRSLDIKEIEIYDVLGLRLFSLSFREGRDEAIDVSILPEGIYFIQIENEKGFWNGRFVKQ